MNRTSPIVVFVNQDALEIKADAAFTVQAGGIQSFADVDDLETAVPNVNPYATYEPDFWLLDGTYKFAPAAAHVGYMSTGMSAAGSDFGTDPEIRVQFTADHSTTGLTLYFSEHTGDWADSITITFRNSGGSVIRSDTYAPTSAVFETNQAVSNFRRIDIFFLSTNKPQRYARLTGIDLDELTLFQGESIKAATLIEQIDPLSLELLSDTLNLTLFSSDGDFSIVEPAGIYANLQYKEPLDVYEEINGEVVYMGRFYLDTWKSESENIATFEASDAIGLLDKATVLFEGINNGLYPESGAGLTAEDLIQQIFDDVQTDIEWEIDASIASTTVKGWLPVESARETLQQIAFRIGAYVTCARSNKIRILPMEIPSSPLVYDYAITAALKGINSNITLREYINKIELLSHNYVYDNGAGPDVGRVFFDGSLAVGSHLIFFDVLSSVKDFTGTATYTIDTDLLFNVNYVRVDVTGAGTFKIEQLAGYIHTTNRHSLSAATPVPVDNTVRIEDAYLIVPSHADEVIERVFMYYAQRYAKKLKLFAHQASVGDILLIDVQSGRQMTAVIERMEIDLAAGMVANVDAVGSVVPSSFDINVSFNPGKHNDTHVKFTYTGTWGTAADGGAYNSDLHFIGNGNSGYVEFSFTGIKLIFIYRQTSSQGSVNVYIDGVLAATIDQNGSTVNQLEWDSGYLTGIYHTVKIEKVGTSGVVNLDAVEII